MPAQMTISPKLRDRISGRINTRSLGDEIRDQSKVQGKPDRKDRDRFSKI